MTIGSSIFLIAVGAILYFAVTESVVAGIQLQTVGLILMVLGVLGLVLGLILMSRQRRAAPVQRETVVERDPRDPRY